MNLIHNQIGKILVQVLSKVQWTFANWRNSRGSIGESLIGENLIGESRNSRLKEIPRLHEEFRREIGTLFLDRLSISDGRPQPTAPQTSATSLPHHSSEISGASFR
jgi:hypothetical protein